MSNYRSRIAPSPTGYAHVGTAYTALFNFGFARHNKGTFIIRIEDSDLKRNIEGAELRIYEALEWLGITWDEGTTKGGDFGPYKLSDRLTIYQEKAQELVKEGKAYEDDGAIRFKNLGETVSWDDMVRGEISFPGDQITDFVIMKSDGYPTYNFNVVVDDHMMGITHVIRGEEHISNTPRQIALYKAFGYELPKFGHHPLLLNAQKQKLSKRDAAVDIMAYKEMGILPEAFVNFLALMGWSHPEEQEIFSLKEFTDKFTIERVRKSGAIFNMDKLLWINAAYIKACDDAQLVNMILDFYPAKYHEDELKQIIPLAKERMRTLADFEKLAGFFFAQPDVERSLFTEKYHDHISSAYAHLEKIDDSAWNLDMIGQELAASCAQGDFHRGNYFMDLRIAITGNKITPPLNESLVILGKNETLQRLKNVL